MLPTWPNDTPFRRKDCNPVLFGPLEAIGAIGALMNRVRQPRTLVVLGLNAEMGTAAGADELVEVPYRDFRPGPKRTPFFYRRVLSRARRKEFDKNGQTIKVLKVIDYVDS